ncbi:response regulator transcription factor [Cohnella faecalis]|uniref:DNA-binding response regulator n=1 Tax=Cohnella faecalis TaxID=2315694 RepID=A0A398CMC3_9BACL|nr:response regulator transcription factor [Cohnella faecalis]RIE00791.1 DNA-binding response regulator [Cohnella faecalis]
MADTDSSVRIWIVEDDPDWLRGLKAYLGGQNGISVEFASDSPEEVRHRLESEDGRSAPDVVLMDIMLNDVPEGIALAEETASATGARVIMLTSMEEKEFIFRSFQAGAIDYQIKSNYETLPEAIRQAARREAPISAAAAERMREEFRRLRRLEREFEAHKMRELITPSELQLLELIDQGYSQSQIADRLVVSIRTVKNHINSILKKLRLGGSKDAARQAKEMGLFGSGNGEKKG